jgi:hypothetical protein
MSTNAYHLFCRLSATTMAPIPEVCPLVDGDLFSHRSTGLSYPLDSAKTLSAPYQKASASHFHC